MFTMKILHEMYAPAFGLELCRMQSESLNFMQTLQAMNRKLSTFRFSA